VIEEAVHGPDHPEVAVTLVNLAALLEGQGKCDEAEPLYRRALAIKEGFGAAPAGAAGAAAGKFGGDDPNMDPELAMALRVSMEEQHARQDSEALPAPEPLSTVSEALDAASAVAAPTDAAPRRRL
jgi:hypothetical protein